MFPWNFESGVLDVIRRMRSDALNLNLPLNWTWYVLSYRSTSHPFGYCVVLCRCDELFKCYSSLLKLFGYLQVFRRIPNSCKTSNRCSNSPIKRNWTTVLSWNKYFITSEENIFPSLIQNSFKLEILHTFHLFLLKIPWSTLILPLVFKAFCFSSAL
jgi:hypothetical protein